jgi:hypothetical protein
MEVSEEENKKKQKKKKKRTTREACGVDGCSPIQV